MLSTRLAARTMSVTGRVVGQVQRGPGGDRQRHRVRVEDGFAPDYLTAAVAAASEGLRLWCWKSSLQAMTLSDVD